MDREFLAELFSSFGAVDIKRMFSGFGISADGVTFALSLRAGLFLRTDPDNIPKFEREGCRPFEYTTRRGTVTVNSYWQLPPRLFDEPEELAVWAAAALAAARRAAAAKPRRKRPSSVSKKTDASAVRKKPVKDGKGVRSKAKQGNRRRTKATQAT